MRQYVTINDCFTVVCIAINIIQSVTDLITIRGVIILFCAKNLNAKYCTENWHGLTKGKHDSELHLCMYDQAFSKLSPTKIYSWTENISICLISVFMRIFSQRKKIDPQIFIFLTDCLSTRTTKCNKLVLLKSRFLSLVSSLILSCGPAYISLSRAQRWHNLLPGIKVTAAELCSYS